jgi:probable biosynthetic protein (TIGR04098 family)
MDIGPNTRISSKARLDFTNPRGIHIGSGTSITPGVSIFTHDFVHNIHVDTLIGSNCFIGSNAIILPGVTIGDNCIIGAGSVVMSNIPKGSLAFGNPARVIRGNIDTREYGVLSPPSERPATEQDTLSSRMPLSGTVADLVLREAGLQDSAALDVPLEEADIDSFGLISLRTSLEARLNLQIPDEQWSSIRTLGDIKRLPILYADDMRQDQKPRPDNPVSVDGAPDAPLLSPTHSRRRYTINMPQMALSGLGEGWLFKEIGDIHWNLISRFLAQSSSRITDSEGDRLYATFTRILLKVQPYLQGFSENDPLEIESRLRRYGASMYFCDHSVRTLAASCNAITMSTFAKYGEKGKNTTLIKGTPTIPNPETLPSEPELPDFAAEYRKRRAERPDEVIFEHEYKINPPQDINGVGLLYFAAYPIIAGLCIAAYEGSDFFYKYGVDLKDICYFANADPMEALLFRLHQREDHKGTLKHVCSLSRASDGERMADIISCWKKLP